MSNKEWCRDIDGHDDCPNHATAEKHSCPYAEDIHDDPTPVCQCCSDCEYECVMDI